MKCCNHQNKSSGMKKKQNKETKYSRALGFNKQNRTKILKKQSTQIYYHTRRGRKNKKKKGSQSLLLLLAYPPCRSVDVVYKVYRNECQSLAVCIRQNSRAEEHKHNRRDSQCHSLREDSSPPLAFVINYLITRIYFPPPNAKIFFTGVDLLGASCGVTEKERRVQSSPVQSKSKSKSKWLKCIRLEMVLY